jgi:hypothetical protein
MNYALFLRCKGSGSRLSSGHFKIQRVNCERRYGSVRLPSGEPSRAVETITNSCSRTLTVSCWPFPGLSGLRAEADVQRTCSDLPCLTLRGPTVRGAARLLLSAEATPSATRSRRPAHDPADLLLQHCDPNELHRLLGITNH